MKIYNGENMILGRLASLAAKDALLGEEVKVLNCEKIIISGKKANTLALQLERRKRKGHPHRSQNISRLPERYVRRAIRGMLPRKTARGREAWKRVLCYRGVPSDFAGKEMNAPEKASASKLPTLYYLPVGDLCRGLGWKGQ